MAKYPKVRVPPRMTLCPGEPSVEQIEATVESDHVKKIELSRRLSMVRVEFSVRYVASKRWPMNPRSLTLRQLNEIRHHPQYLNPHGCSARRRAFVLETPVAA